MDYNMPMAAKQHSSNDYLYNTRKPKGLYDTSRPYFNSGCITCIGVLMLLAAIGLVGLEIALYVLEGEMARTYVCGIWAGIVVFITGILCFVSAKSQRTPAIILTVAFCLLSIGVCAAVGVISYEALDWDLDDYGDGDGKRIARVACEGVRAFCALIGGIMSLIAFIICLRSMCSEEEEVIYHKFHDEYTNNSSVPPHYVQQSNTLRKEEPIQPEPELVNEEPIRRKKQSESKAAPAPTPALVPVPVEEHTYAYENHLMRESSEQRTRRWESHVREVEPLHNKRDLDYGPLPSANPNPNPSRHASIPNAEESNTLYVSSNAGFVMVKPKSSAPNSIIGGSMTNLNTVVTPVPAPTPAPAVSVPNLAPAETMYDTAKGQLPATHYYEPTPATTVVGTLNKGTTVSTTGYRPATPERRQSRGRSRSPSPKRRSPSPRHKRSPSPRRRRSRSPKRRSSSPRHRRSPSPRRRRSPSPKRRRSPSPKRRRSPSPKHRRSRSPSPRRHSRSTRKSSPRHRSRSASPVEYSSYD